MRAVIVLPLVVILFITIGASVAQDCEILSSCDLCLQNISCIYCSVGGCITENSTNYELCTNQTAGAILTTCSEEPIPDVVLPDSDQIRSAIQNSRNGAMNFNRQNGQILTLTRDQLYIFNTFDVCGEDNASYAGHYFPSNIHINVKFVLNGSIDELVASNIGLQSLEGNRTKAEKWFETGCSTGPEYFPKIYVLNHEGMILLGMESYNQQYAAVAHRLKTFDDERVTFSFMVVTSSAVTRYISSLLLLLVALLHF